MEPWRRVLREGLLRALTDAELNALRGGWRTMTLPPPLECLHDWQVEGADLLAYPAWRAQSLKTVKEVEESAWALTSTIDARLGEGAVKVLVRWYDDAPRPDMRHTLLGETERELMVRMIRQAAGAAARTA